MTTVILRIAARGLTCVPAAGICPAAQSAQARGSLVCRKGWDGDLCCGHLSDYRVVEVNYYLVCVEDCACDIWPYCCAEHTFSLFRVANKKTSFV